LKKVKKNRKEKKVKTKKRFEKKKTTSAKNVGCYGEWLVAYTWIDWEGKSGSAADKAVGGSNHHFPLSTSLNHEQKRENLINRDIRKEKKGAEKEADS